MIATRARRWTATTGRPLRWPGPPPPGRSRCRRPAPPRPLAGRRRAADVRSPPRDVDDDGMGEGPAASRPRGPGTPAASTGVVSSTGTTASAPAGGRSGGDPDRRPGTTATSAGHPPPPRRSPPGGPARPPSPGRRRLPGSRSRPWRCCPTAADRSPPGPRRRGPGRGPPPREAPPRAVGRRSRPGRGRGPPRRTGDGSPSAQVSADDHRSRRHRRPAPRPRHEPRHDPHAERQPRPTTAIATDVSVQNWYGRAGRGGPWPGRSSTSPPRRRTREEGEGGVEEDEERGSDDRGSDREAGRAPGTARQNQREPREAALRPAGSRHRARRPRRTTGGRAARRPCAIAPAPRRRARRRCWSNVPGPAHTSATRSRVTASTSAGPPRPGRGVGPRLLERHPDGVEEEGDRQAAMTRRSRPPRQPPRRGGPPSTARAGVGAHSSSSVRACSHQSRS